MPLKFIHAADFHLGADLRRLGSDELIETLREAQFGALEKTLAAAVEQQVSFVLICGDLFDSRFPNADIIEKTRKLLSRFSSVPVFILPGTHDFLSDDSVLAGNVLTAGIDNIVVLNDKVQSPYLLPTDDCRLYFLANRSNRSAFSPLAECRIVEGCCHNIALGHGSLSLGGLGVDYDYPLDPKDIEKSGFDYIALGHWHKPRLEKLGKSTLAYSGIPQPLGFSDPENGSVNIVTIGDNGDVNIDRVTTSTVIFKSVSERIYHPRQLINLLETAADNNCILKIDLEYSDKFKEYTEIETIIDKARSRYLLINADNSYPNKPAALPERDSREESNLLIDNFLTELDRLKETDSPQRAGLYEKAAELGLKIIRGEA
ncbi:MAG: DNA repair exonuclease [FCB group bacterium]|nr:DNA repair exonuclease [FCB group bacterium]